MLETLNPGFDDAVTQSQHIFHQAMMALANPGKLHTLSALLHDAPKPLSPGAAAVVLALADYETPLWLDAPLATSEAVCHYLRFHTGAAIVENPNLATFALISAPEQLDIGFAQFSQGNAEYPDRSTTLIVQFYTIDASAGFQLTGPGIPEKRQLSFTPQPANFLSHWQKNRAGFPCGIDLFGVAKAQLFGLPRSTKIEGAPCM